MSLSYFRINWPTPAKLHRHQKLMVFVYALLVGLSILPLEAVWEQGMNFQGRVLSDGLAFNGVGKFKFALVQSSGATTTTLWSHDGTSSDGAAPASFLSLPVSQGQYAIQLGNATVMQPFPDTLFDQPSLSLRIWFDDGSNGEQQLAPDLPITAVLFANRSKVAESVISLPDEMIALRHLNAELQTALTDLVQRLEFLETRGSMISNQPQDAGLEALGYVLYQSSGANPVNLISDAGLPSNRQLAESASGQGAWLVWGGQTALGQPLASGAWEDLSTGAWTATSSLDAPAPRSGHVMVPVGDTFFIHGGQGASSVLDSAHLFDPAFNEWTTVATPNGLTARVSHAGVALQDGQSVMLFGGRTAEGLSNRIDVFNTQTKSWDSTVTAQLSNLLTQRQDSQMARVGQWVLIWGGENASGPLGDGVRLDIANGYSHVMTPAGPEARTRFSMTVVGDKIAIWGGEGLNGDLNNGALYEPASNTWTSMAASASVPGRHGHQAYASGTELILVGGESQGQPVGAIDAYSTATSTWRKVESNVSLPFYPAAHVRSSKLFLATGRQSGGGMNQALVEIDLTPNLYYYRKP